MSWKELAFLDEVATLSDNAPEDVDKSVAAEGTGTAASRDDHKHDVSVAAPVAITENASQAEGSATSLARSDHEHESPSEWAPSEHAVDHKEGGSGEIDLDELGDPTGPIEFAQQQADGLIFETATSGPDAASEIGGQVYYNSTDKAVYVWVPA